MSRKAGTGGSGCGGGRPPGLTFPTCSGGEGLLPQSDPEPQGLIVALGSHRQDVRFDGVGRRSILSDFPCPTERILPLLGTLGFLLLARCFLPCSPFPIPSLTPKTQHRPTPLEEGPTSRLRLFSASSLCPFSSHLPVIPRRLDHVSILRFCISALFCPGTVARPSPVSSPSRDNSRGSEDRHCGQV